MAGNKEISKDLATYYSTSQSYFQIFGSRLTHTGALLSGFIQFNKYVKSISCHLISSL